MNNPLPQQQDWDRFWNPGNAKTFSRESWSKKRIKQLLSLYIEEGKTVLDAGCGSGFFSKYFYECGLNVYSLDYSSDALESTRKITDDKTKVIQLDLVQSRLEKILGVTFDFIFSDGLFEHFCCEDQDRIMNNFRAVLNPGGKIITFVPNRWSPWQIIRPFMMKGIKETPFVLSGLKELNSRNQLKIVSAGGVNVLPFRFSPEKSLASCGGMLLYSISEKE